MNRVQPPYVTYVSYVVSRVQPPYVTSVSYVVNRVQLTTNSAGQYHLSGFTD